MSGARPPSWDEVLALLRQLDAGDADEVTLEMPGLRVFMSRQNSTPPPARGDGIAAAQATSADAGAGPSTEEDGAAPANASAGPRTATASKAQPDREGLVAVTAPMLGVFYRAPSPDDPPFVEVGDHVTPGDTVATLEVMKLFHPVEAEVAGAVVEIVAVDGVMVEHCQPLLYIDPDGA